jgi:ActR/RegA family two-component response regulator
MPLGVFSIPLWYRSGVLGPIAYRRNHDADRGNSMSRILVVDDDIGTLETFSSLLQLDGHAVATSATGAAAAVTAEAFRPDIALVDLQLPDVSGLKVIEQLLHLHPGVACVLVTGYGTYEHAIEAVKCGAVALAAKPLFGDQLLSVVRDVAQGLTISRHHAWAERAQRHEPSTHEACEPQLHSVARWARLVMAVLDSPSDPRTLTEWGRVAAVSTGGLRNWCRTASLSARASLLFARVLRAVWLSRAGTNRAEDLLDIIDRRTLVKMLDAAGGGDARLPGTVDDFLEQQEFIRDPRALESVRIELRRRDPSILSSRNALMGFGCAAVQRPRERLKGNQS